MSNLHAVRNDPRAHINRAHAAVYSCAIIALLYHRSLSLLLHHHNSSLLLITFSDLILAFMWALTQAFRWQPIRRREFPHRLPADDRHLPALDVFVCTADPSKEPPVVVANTVLSALAFDYPPEKLSVYVSDDGGSQVTLFALAEAAGFARRYWLHFCRENGLVDRCPEAYFRSSPSVVGGGAHFDEIKGAYQSMKERIERVVDRGWFGNDEGGISEAAHDAFKKWTADFTRQEHPTVIQVLSDSSKDKDINGQAMPNLIYVSREKSRTTPHNFKAGALNALVRVSSGMTNAGVVLTLDCDVFSNDPETPRRALCYFLDTEMAPELAYVQFPQRFRGIDRDDIYGNEHKRLSQVHPSGMDGLRGPKYLGTGCFFSRRALSGGLLAGTGGPVSSEESLRWAHQVASCTYEIGTQWGSKVGFRYGSIVEDYNTGYQLHCEGWRSVFCHPQRPAFLGEVPITLHDNLSQVRRWCVGFLEVAFSKRSPIIFGTRRVSLLMGMCYAMISFWGLWCIPITTYAFLPQLALLHQVPLFPKVSEPWFYLYAYLFLAAYAQDLIDFLVADGTIWRWWNDQRMWLIRGVTSHLFGLAEFSLKQMGLPSFGFNVTSKMVEEEKSRRYERGVFDFGVDSPYFVSLGTIAMVNISCFVVGLVRTLSQGSVDGMLVQLLITGFVVVNCWPVYEAMVFRRDSGRMPKKVTIYSVLLTGFLLIAAHFSFRI